jgi:hypothetical protein
MENQIENFRTGMTLTKKLEIALDYGMQWFPNGQSKQMVYSLHQNGKLIHQTISTKILTELHAVILFGLHDQFVEVRMTMNPKKKFWTNNKIIVSI